jgi:hypothetical protein
MSGPFRWLGIFCAAAVAGCAGPADSPKNLVLIVVDTLRADVLGCGSMAGVSPSRLISRRGRPLSSFVPAEITGHDG